MRLAYSLLIIIEISSCISSKKAERKEIISTGNNIVAHRGAFKKNNLPENSIASLKQAIELKCNGSEFDVRMTADDSLIINHDPQYNKLPVEKTNYKDLIIFKLSNGEKLPTLREYILAGIENNITTRLVCEIKPSEINKERGQIIAEKVIKLVQELKAGKVVQYISFDYEILKKIIQIAPGSTTQYLEGNKSPDQVKAEGISGVDYHISVFMNHPEWIESAKKNSITLNAWTVNKAEEMDWLLVNGFDFITTNEPELLFDRIKQSPVSNGWKLTWSDEFNYKGLPDSSKWNYEVGGHGWGNNEKQFYLKNAIENANVTDGKLHIVALKKDYENSKYTSAKLTTYQKLKLQYGKIEVMAKLPRGKGSWPAIWMLPESILKNEEKWPLCGEIDIMEHVGKDPGVIHSSLHSELYNHIKGTQITHFEKQQDVFDTFHKYAIEWSQGSIKFYIDDKLFFESFKGQEGRNAKNEGWPFDKPYYLILNLAVGGNWGGEIDDAIFPNEMQIDYVRIYQKTGGNISK
jgi:beta-glucanase (GH16 family)/glycerophosphoryl diester phosphodiesterase